MKRSCISTLHALRTRVPDADIRVYTVNPRDTAERHGVDVAPLRSGTRTRAQRPDQQPGGRSDSLRAVVRQIPVVAPMLRTGVRFLHHAKRAAREPGFIVRSWRRLRGSDLLLIAGSNQLEDWFGGPSGIHTPSSCGPCWHGWLARPLHSCPSAPGRSIHA